MSSSVTLNLGYFLLKQAVSMNRKLPISAKLTGGQVLGSTCLSFPILVLPVHGAKPSYYMGDEDLNSSPLASTKSFITH